MRTRSPRSRRSWAAPPAGGRPTTTTTACGGWATWRRPTSPTASSWFVSGAQLPFAELLAHPAVVDTVKNGLAKMNEEGRGSSMRVKRVLLMTEPPQVDGQEITDTTRLLNVIAQIKPGTAAKVHLVRKSREMDLDVTIGKRPPPPKQPAEDNGGGGDQDDDGG